MASNFHFSGIFYHLQVQVLKKLDLSDFANLAESSHSANQLIETAKIQPIKEIPALCIGHFYEGDKTKQRAPKYSMAKEDGKSRIPKHFSTELLNKWMRFGVEKISFMQLTDFDCLQTFKIFEEGTILNDNQLLLEKDNHRKTGKFLPLNLCLEIAHLNTQTCQPATFFRLLEVLKPKSLNFFHCDKYFLRQSAIQKTGDFKLGGTIDEGILMSLEAPRLTLQNVSWNEDCSAGVNRFLKEWFSERREIEKVTFRLEDDFDVDRAFRSLPYRMVHLDNSDDLDSKKKKEEGHRMYLVGNPQRRILLELTPTALTLKSTTL